MQKLIESKILFFNSHRRTFVRENVITFLEIPTFRRRSIVLYEIRWHSMRKFCGANSVILSPRMLRLHLWEAVLGTLRGLVCNSIFTHAFTSTCISAHRHIYHQEDRMRVVTWVRTDNMLQNYSLCFSNISF